MMKHDNNAVAFEPLPQRARLSTLIMPGATALDDAIAAVLIRLDRALPQFGTRFPAPSSVDLVYPPIENVEWTNGFWTGLMWLAWEITGAACFRDAAQAQGVGFEERAARRVSVDHHDLGFLYTLSSCAQFQLTGHAAARTAGLEAARLLLARYDPVARVIQAWGDMRDPDQRGRMIIDCNLNLPLLYWAAAQTGDARFSVAANNHLERAAALLVRPDASTFHTFYVDTATGEPRFGRTHQGHSDDSCWARGQAWGIYGFALGFRHTGCTAYLDLAVRLAHYFLNRLPDDLVCCWDLVFTASDIPRDTSAAAIAACGLLEIVQHLPLGDSHREDYARAAWAIVTSLNGSYLAPIDGANGILTDAVYHMPNDVGVRESCIWGDYFYLEALMRLRRAWRPYWA